MTHHDHDHDHGHPHEEEDADPAAAKPAVIIEDEGGGDGHVEEDGDATGTGTGTGTDRSGTWGRLLSGVLVSQMVLGSVLAMVAQADAPPGAKGKRTQWVSKRTAAVATYAGPTFVGAVVAVAVPVMMLASVRSVVGGVLARHRAKVFLTLLGASLGLWMALQTAKKPDAKFQSIAAAWGAVMGLWAMHMLWLVMASNRSRRVVGQVEGETEQTNSQVARRPPPKQAAADADPDACGSGGGCCSSSSVPALRNNFVDAVLASSSINGSGAPPAKASTWSAVG